MNWSLTQNPTFVLRMRSLRSNLLRASCGKLVLVRCEGQTNLCHTVDLATPKMIDRPRYSAKSSSQGECAEIMFSRIQLSVWK